MNFMATGIATSSVCGVVKNGGTNFVFSCVPFMVEAKLLIAASSIDPVGFIIIKGACFYLYLKGYMNHMNENEKER